MMRKFSSSVSEIEEESSSELFEISSGVPIREEVDQDSLFSYHDHDHHDHFPNGDQEDAVYVAVGKSSSDHQSSMDALVWTINHAVNPSTVVFLIHVFPEIRHIPTPLGKLPISQVNPEQKENYMSQERSKRREFLQKYLDKCSAFKVKVDTILIESDMEAKAILDLIPILNITKLVVGTTKSNLRKLRSRRGSEIFDQIIQNAPEFCDVKMVCEGKEVVDLMTELSSPRGNDDSPKPTLPEKDQSNDSFTCACFKLKVIS
uniref:U-box domain-containing protein 35 n=1 Tax=Davidia involucrata TaxID=16924 RepID=A0A5B7AZL0_DAVIN